MLGVDVAHSSGVSGLSSSKPYVSWVCATSRKCSGSRPMIAGSQKHVNQP